jgi:hypothetical protein
VTTPAHASEADGRDAPHATYSIPIEGRDEWLAAAGRLA